MLSLRAPLLNEHKDRLNAALPRRFHELYGLTEGFLTILDRTKAVHNAGSVGRVPPFHAMRILRDWINERVGARDPRVSRVVFHDAFLRSASGKTLKRELRAPYWAGTGWQV